MSTSDQIVSDVFISYCHVDNIGFARQLMEDGDQFGWVDIFHDALQERLDQLSGKRGAIKVWRDAKNISGNDRFTEFTEEACRRSRVLICITSPGYMQSRWCENEYRICQSSTLRQDEFTSRIFNVRLQQIPISFTDKYVEKFGASLGYRFFDPDTNRQYWPATPDHSNQPYDISLNHLAKSIFKLFDLLHDDSDVRSGLNNELETDIGSIVPSTVTLADNLLQAKSRCVISGHTFDKFCRDPDAMDAIRTLIEENVEVVIVILNPKSAYARAHGPYHAFESSEVEAAQIHDSVRKLSELLESSRSVIRKNLP